MEVNQEIIENLKALVRSITKAIQKIWGPIWKWIKENTDVLYRWEEQKKRPNRNRYKMDFSRKKVSHRVADRRPKQMIRKIIR
ncbi:hypothetical protein ACIQYS_09660 [Psychrobacillus sp. NPDC096426]|uniref:hypothetical protein n=1 Tax=Psychrobacillus sp. NPDC096426 TaxID=3364491 RepID=UPI0037FCD67B